MSVDSSALRQQVEEYARELFTAATEIMAGYAEQEAPVASGETRDSVRVLPGDTTPPLFTAQLIVPTPQAAWTDEGTDPHEIHGNPWLAFTVNGRKVVINTTVTGPVNHPGSTKLKGWFSDGIATDARWSGALQEAQF